jgi:hypothetical protein
VVGVRCHAVSRRPLMRTVERMRTKHLTVSHWLEVSRAQRSEPGQERPLTTQSGGPATCRAVANFYTERFRASALFSEIGLRGLF